MVFTYQITATNNPTSFSLGDALLMNVNSSTGEVSVHPAGGVFTFKVGVTNATEPTQQVAVTIGDNAPFEYSMANHGLLGGFPFGHYGGGIDQLSTPSALLFIQSVRSG